MHIILIIIIIHIIITYLLFHSVGVGYELLLINDRKKDQNLIKTMALVGNHRFDTRKLCFYEWETDCARATHR